MASKNSTAGVTVTRDMVNVSGGTLGSHEIPLTVIDNKTYGRVGVTFDEQFSQNRDGTWKAVYWLRFEKLVSDSALEKAGWHAPRNFERRKGYWSFVGEKAEATLRELGVPDSMLPTRTKADKPQQSAPAKPADKPADKPATDGNALAHLSDKALAQLLEQVSNEIARRMK